MLKTIRKLKHEEEMLSKQSIRQGMELMELINMESETTWLIAYSVGACIAAGLWDEKLN